ncbi:MAG: cyclic nucleotide-binding domain-containing protein [Candidatus Riflebacteria bacterium]|nr:cyclic nucleotide-binding domain-containing protein [Candidatus Riflebacteria bacterium]
MLAIKDLSQADRDIIVRNMVRKTIERNDVLYNEGRECVGMYFVETGALKLVSRKAKDGLDDVMLGAVKAGSFCGEVALLRDDALYEDTAVAMETSVVLELNKSSMQKIMVASMTAGTKLLLSISRNIREAIAMPQSQELGRIIAFVSPKDGQGRTTVATHLAKYLAGAGKRTILIDCDLQLGDANVHMGLSSQPHMARMAQSEERLTFDVIKKYSQNSGGALLLAAPHQPQEAEFVSRSNLNQIIQECARNCDYLILDVPCHIDETAILLWDLADLMVFVTESNISSLTRLKRLMIAISRLNYPKEKFLGIANRYSESQKEYLENLRAILPCKWHTIAHADEEFAEALLKGNPVWQVAYGSRAAKDLDAICHELLGKAPQTLGKGGVFSRIKSWFTE